MAFKLKLTSWKFLAGVDAGAQGKISNVALVKRAPTGDEYTITCKVGKLDEALGVVFGYAFATTLDGGKSAHVDLQDDAIVGGDELIKVALGFVEAGALSDVMHSENPDGYCPFVMPLNAETKKAFKLSGDVEGVAIGMKPSAETFKRFVSGELQGFSIGGTGIREPLGEQKRAPAGKVEKAALYTDEVDGHAHKICIYDDGAFYVDYATMAGADQSHSHGIIRGDDGTLVILADSGHTHALADGQPSLVVVDANAIVVVAARAPANAAHAKSTPPTADPKVNTMKLVALTEAQHAHYLKLASSSATDAEAFLAKSATDRDAEVAKAITADPVVFKGEKTGLEVRKSDGELAKRNAEIAEKNAVENARLSAEVAKRDDEIEKADVRKAAAEILKGMPGEDATHDYIVRSIRKGGGDAAMIEKAVATLKGMRETSTLGKGAAGSGGSELPTDTGPQAALAAMVAKHAADNKCDERTARLAVVKTEKGRDLYNQIEDLRKSKALGGR